MKDKSEHPTKRFTKTIDFYHKYRPRYPEGVIEIMEKKCGLSKQSTVVDIGSGTGIFTELLLNSGFTVYGIEPNREMREFAEDVLNRYPKFNSMDGSAEEVPLSDHSLDLITAAQAFHWFDIPIVRKEFQRVLKNGGWVVLLWNLRNNKGSPFMEAYEELLSTYGTDYKTVAAENISDREIRKFFSPQPCKKEVIGNEQVLDLDGLKGRLLSTSYLPKPGDANVDNMLHFAEEMFKTYQKGGVVKMLYNTTIYYGQLLSN